VIVPDADNDQSGEDRLIARHFRPLARHPGAFALSDDAAALSPPAGMDLVLTTDTIVAGVHFFPDDAAGDVARKALRVNLSDLAAKGAEPAGFLLSLVLPEGTTDEWLAGFAAGMRDDAAAYECPLMGGDTVRTPGPLTVAVTAFGVVPQGRMVRRGGAAAGDSVFVTGTVGDAALGLMLRRDADTAARWQLTGATRDYLLARYLLPQPRNALATAVREHASAAMDVSDGLAGDLAKLCRVSGVSAEIDVAELPLSEAVRTAVAAQPDVIERVLTGGDDYEVLATIPPAKVETFRRTAAAAGVPVTSIGCIARGHGSPGFIGRDGQPIVLDRLSFSHF
jgi:thiamine-monophosphate kinase